MANPVGTADPHERLSFVYDKLGRLHTATNPENGTTTYNYDENGNLTSKIDSRGTIFHGFDAINRLASKLYSGSGWSSTPSVTLTYDNNLPITGISGVNYPKGRLVQASNSISTTTYRYGGLGCPLASSQVTAGLAEKVFQYSYIPADLFSMTYPSGRTVGWGYDISGRANTAQPGGAGTAYVTSMTYDPSGGIGKIAYGNGLEENWTYSPTRGQARMVTLGTSAVPASVGSWQYSYCAGQVYSAECSTNNGNIMRHTISPLGAVQTFTYDGMSRLKTFSEAGGPSQTYVYEQYGNRALLTGSTMPPWPPAAVVTSDLPSQVAAIFPSNQWTQSSVVNGYVTQPRTGAYPILTYDAEGRVDGATTGATSSSTASYGYDGEGRRVKRTSSGATTFYVYDATGELAAEYGAVSSITGRNYLTADPLGSTRIVTDANQAVVASQRHDYLPFGDSILAGQGGRTTGQGYGADEATGVLSKLFTGKERDSETGLDYFGARYLSGVQGRWTSPDWSEKPETVPYADVRDPQSLNLYAYVRNNPIGNRDLDGHLCVFGFGSTCPGATPPPPPLPPALPLLTSTGAIAQGPQPPRSAPNAANQPASSQQPQRGLTVGVGGAGNLDVGVGVAGMEVNVSGIVTGSISSAGQPSAAVALSGGAAAYAGNHVAAAPSQWSTPVVGGGYVGGGVTFLVANTASGTQLSGPFQTLAGNVGGGAGASVNLSFDATGTFVFQVTLGPGLGLSGWSTTTNICVAGTTGSGCH